MKKQYKTSLVILLASAISLLSFQVMGNDNIDFVKGIHYKDVNKVVSIAPHKKQVTEVFFYGCPHCYQLKPSTNKWLKTKPKDVHFERMPAVLNNPNWVFMARVFYTAKALGIEERFHIAYFDAIQRDNKKIFDLTSIKKFVAPMGIDGKKYEQMFKSFQVDQMVQKAKVRTGQYAINGVPAIIINGKYITDVPMATSRDNLWKLVDKLVQK